MTATTSLASRVKAAARSVLDAASRIDAVWRWRSVRYSRSLARSTEHELRVLDHLVVGRPFVDVGANTGMYTAYAIGADAGRITAFEPVPELHDRLERLLRPGDELFRGAAADEAGEIALNIPSVGLDERRTRATIIDPSDDGLTYRTVTVPTVRLGQHVDLTDAVVKIDVEGAEQLVLDGAREAIAERLPVALLIESEERHRPGGTAELIASLVPHGYRGWFLLPEQLVDAEDFDPAVHQSAADAAVVEAGAARPQTYANNIVFVRDDLAVAFRQAYGAAAAAD